MPRDGSIGATLIGQARQTDADLMVMGGYGHSRLREWVLGGVTRELVSGAPFTVLMAH